jgi:Domain of unknown function (DUF5060)
MSSLLKLPLLIGVILTLSGKPSVAQQQPVTTVEFSLVDTETDTTIRSLSSREVEIIDFRSLRTTEISFVAAIRTSVVLSNVAFYKDGIFIRDEKDPPYAIGGNIDKDLLPFYEIMTKLCSPSFTNLTAIAYGGQNSSVVGFGTQLVRLVDSTCDTAPPVPTDILPYNVNATGAISGEIRVWHKVTIGFTDGPPNLSETSIPNPFTFYRLDVTFTVTISGSNRTQSYVVPGYYAADGNAANTGATSGTVWLVHFVPPNSGLWTWVAKFKAGENVAQNGGGQSVSTIDGLRGSFTVSPTDKTSVGRDFRGHGQLQYTGEHYLRFAQTRKYFIKVGPDSPENFLAYDEFDNTPNMGGLRKSWSPHTQDYTATDPTWRGGKGKSIIGVLNYLSKQGMNVVSFLTMNINGDDKNVFPYVFDTDRTRIDVSKTAQWEILFEHADHMGLYLHFKTQEQENDQLLDGGNLGNERKLYYRELVARFGHHLALSWNLGEENTNTFSQHKGFCDYIRLIDPYKHNIVLHTFPNEKDKIYSKCHTVKICMITFFRFLILKCSISMVKPFYFMDRSAVRFY